jgi:hypothetical protein
MKFSTGSWLPFNLKNSSLLPPKSLPVDEKPGSITLAHPFGYSKGCDLSNRQEFRVLLTFIRRNTKMVSRCFPYVQFHLKAFPAKDLRPARRYFQTP